MHFLFVAKEISLNRKLFQAYLGNALKESESLLEFKLWFGKLI